MDRMGVYDRQKSNAGTPGAPTSPIMTSPLNRHARAGSTGTSNMRRAQNNATKAAAQRLAQVMATQTADEDDDEDDASYELSGTGSIGLAGGRAVRGRSAMTVRTPQQQAPSARSRSPMTVPATQEQAPSARSRSPMTVRTAQEQAPSARSRSPLTVRAAQDQTSSSRSRSPIMSVRTAPEQAPSVRSCSPITSVRTALEQPPSTRGASSGRSSLPVNDSVEQPPSARAISGRSAMLGTYTEQPLSAHSIRPSPNPADLSPSARTIIITRSPQPSNTIDQPSSARAASAVRQNVGVKPISLVPPSVPIALRPTSSSVPTDSPLDTRKDRKMSFDMGSMNLRESGNRRPHTALEDEVDMLHEENESLLEKLRLAEERCEEAESRARLLEQQVIHFREQLIRVFVSNLGEGVTLEARLLYRKEAALQQREAALRLASQSSKTQGFAALRAEAEVARDEATSALEQLQETANELKSLRNMTQRMILTPEEMEEVVLKRCWLARYWGLCVQHGIHADIAGIRYNYWSSFASNPAQVLLAAGQRAREEIVDDLEETENPRDLNEFSGEGNIENMLVVDQGLRELTSLRVEEALALVMAAHRRPNFLKAGFSDDLKLPIEGQVDVFELSKEEAEDVSVKQAWLAYIWRRAKKHGIEPDIAAERLQYWINQNSKFPTSNDAVDVQRGLLELKKLGIESMLWEHSRRAFEEDTDKPKIRSHSEFG